MSSISNHMSIPAASNATTFPDVCAVSRVLLRLQEAGVSALGARQLMTGEIVTGLGDRLAIVRVIPGHAVENDETHWVGHDIVSRVRTETVDKDETITIHQNRTENLRRAGMSNFGITQFLSGMSITNATDRERLAVFIAN